MDTNPSPDDHPAVGPELPPGSENTAQDRLLTVEREGSGDSVIFLARTRNAAEVAELDELFQELRAGCRVRILSRGPVTAAAARVIDDADGRSMAELMGLLETLGARYSFSKVDLGLHPTLNRLIEDMALDSGSRLTPAPNCSLCGRPEPFPTRLTLQDPGGKPAEGLYCARCVARFSDGSERDHADALLRSDTRTFGEAGSVELSPNPARKGNRTSFVIRRHGPLAATG